jgi:putative PIN family toxin of toxin-antitoxin system
LRAVLDPNVLISALLSPTGVPAALLKRWLDGDFELIVSKHLLAELRRALSYPKIRGHVSGDEAEAFIVLLQGAGTMAQDPASPPQISRDAGDDYLLALARSTAAVLVSGDEDLLEVRDAPVESPRSFMSKLTRR